MTSFTLYGIEANDFWEHSAVVKELATHPLSPLHPLFNEDKPHMFFSPYLLSVGLLARWGSLTPMDALGIAGVGNLLFLLICLRLFIHRFFEKCHDAISFYALIFILFLWPANAWDWSGFIHFKILGQVMPYPSTFAIAMTFLLFVLYHHTLAINNGLLLILTSVLLAVVLLTHPPTAVVTCIGILAISLHFFNILGPKAFVTGFLLFVAAISLALLWPYYSFFDLLPFNNSGKSTPQPYSMVMYERAQTLWPTALLFPLALPLLITRLRSNKFDAFTWISGLVLLVYVAGYFVGHITGLYVFGRTISFLAIFFQIALAARLAQSEMEARGGKLIPSIPIFLLIGLTLLTVSLNTPNKIALVRAYKGFQGLKHSYNDFETLGQHVNQYDVVISDIKSSWKIPAFSGKIIASKHPVAYINDHQARRDDQKRFFSQEVQDEERKSILKKYQVDYIYVNKKRISEVKPYFRFGNFIYENNNFLLLKTFQKKDK